MSKNTLSSGCQVSLLCTKVVQKNTGENALNYPYKWSANIVDINKNNYNLTNITIPTYNQISLSGKNDTFTMNLRKVEGGSYWTSTHYKQGSWPIYFVYSDGSFNASNGYTYYEEDNYTEGIVPIIIFTLK